MTLVFPSWARLALGSLIAITTYLVNGTFVHLDDSAMAAISSCILAFGAVGIVPPKPGDFYLSPPVALGLTVAAIVANYLLVSLIDSDLARGLLTAVLAFGSSVGITPPQGRVVAPAVAPPV